MKRLITIFLIPLTVVALGTATATADTSRYKPHGGMYLGLDYAWGLDGDNLGDFLYPVFGFNEHWPDFYLDMNTFLPFGFADFIMFGIKFLSTGGEESMPIWETFNDDAEPGMVNMLSMTGRYAFKKNGPHKLDAGLLFDVAMMSPVVRVHGTEPDNLGLINFQVGATTGYEYATDSFVGNFGFQIGDGFTNLSSWNPFVGADVFLRWDMGKHAAWYMHTLARIHRLDFSGYEPVSYGDIPSSAYDFARWEPMMSVDTGILVLF